MNNWRCLELCLRFITWIHKRDYESDKEHWRKDKLSKLWLKYWRDIYYQEKPIWTTHIAVYRTKRNTSHAVVVEDWDIIYNPYCVDDIENVTGYINVQKRISYGIWKSYWSDPFPPRKR